MTFTIRNKGGKPIRFPLFAGAGLTEATMEQGVILGAPGHGKTSMLPWAFERPAEPLVDPDAGNAEGGR